MPYWLGIYDVGTYENGIHGLPIKWETGEKIWEGLWASQPPSVAPCSTTPTPPRSLIWHIWACRCILCPESAARAAPIRRPA